MHIKKLVLDNFKSFGRTTEIPFYEDFTVVTGPNGSGKSNIIDAVLFALGLARTRGIRAEKLTDLIYNPGHADTDTGGPNSSGSPLEATVTVVLDNSAGTINRTQIVNAAGSESIGDVDEIRVKRRIKQTETNYYSYYYLNGRSCNLSDIQDLIAQAGITPEGYNVVMQGDVTEIINMTPQQRRSIIDEIAGVAEFDAKRDDAFEELAAVEDRIEEADLRIEEKQTRLTQLEDERETALKYQSLRDERDEYENYLKAAELESKRTDRSETAEKADEVSADLTEAEETLSQRNQHVSRLTAELDALTAEIERKGEDEQLALKSEIEEIKGAIGRRQNDIEIAEERITDAESTRRDAFVQLDRKQEQIEELNTEIRSIKVEKASITTEIESLENDLAGVETKIENVDAAYDEQKRELEEATDRLNELKTKQSDAQRRKDRLLDETRRRASDIADAKEQLTTLREELPTLQATQSDLYSEVDIAEKNESTIKDAVSELQNKRSKLKGELDTIRSNIQSKQSEYATLEGHASEDNDTSWPRAVTTILNADRTGVHGTVGQLGSVEKQYATACETAAGGRLAHVVVDTDTIGSDCIDYLKSRNAGRATFLPITKMDDRGLPQQPDRQGVIDFAQNLVSYDDTYTPIFSYVLGSTLIVETMETARGLMGEYRMVTLDGDLVERSGAMTGGSGGGSRYSFSTSGGGRLERLAEEIEVLEDQRQEYQSKIRTVDEDISDARERAASARERVRELKSRIDTTETEIEETKTEIEQAESRVASLREERAETDETMQSVDDEINRLSDEITTTEEEIKTIEKELEESPVPELTAEADELRTAIDDAESQINDLDARQNELELERQYANEAVDELNEQIEIAQTKKADAQDAITTAQEDIETHNTTLEEKRAAVDELEDELVSLKSDRSDLQAAVDAAKIRRESARDTVDNLSAKLSSLRNAIDRLEWEIDELEGEVGAYDSAEIPDYDTVENNIDRLSEKMDSLEPVNMLAIDEYDDVESEVDELISRRDILVEEREAIEERINRFESEKRETFMNSFTAINQNFTEIFERLSDGTGELHLENQDDPFDDGLTMKAQPGDKPIQRLNAMSGGEKSLTALAFIFAIQRHNPAPFYALDEIDAFLDAANAERVGEMVDDLAADAQFVVVSHRSALLERSERAIGVTMQGNNISAVTGIQLEGDDGSPEAPADD
ncbi:chromosome segregation protein SMC [Haloquadratum walsbyi]|jgi:condensin subunit Smc|uniref:Chromosome partition protein Smc n=1 Tax=Haloquadratum walsbyi J07HQW2 TaxID=1238425 RepID=U1NHM9_9EURY|nr:chromosome segregation protein SMC [Haloquadratum walsbyi]ERG96363.1 MAG: chromosome segregation protein SMC [Haloquadratum walsbyi J07HQW2]